MVDSLGAEVVVTTNVFMSVAGEFSLGGKVGGTGLEFGLGATWTDKGEPQTWVGSLGTGIGSKIQPNALAPPQ